MEDYNRKSAEDKGDEKSLRSHQEKQDIKDAGCGALIVVGSVALVAALSLLSKGCDGPRNSYNNYGGLPPNASPEGATDYTLRKALGK